MPVIFDIESTIKEVIRDNQYNFKTLIKETILNGLGISPNKFGDIASISDNLKQEILDNEKIQEHYTEAKQKITNVVCNKLFNSQDINRISTKMYDKIIEELHKDIQNSEEILQLKAKIEKDIKKEIINKLMQYDEIKEHFIQKL